MKTKFQVVFLEDASAFMDNIEPRARTKIFYNIRKAQVSNNENLFKKLILGIWEFRTLYNKTQYRLFAFWDNTEKPYNLVVATHGIVKKTSGIPHHEIEKVIQLRKIYFESKKRKL